MTKVRKSRWVTLSPTQGPLCLHFNKFLQWNCKGLATCHCQEAIWWQSPDSHSHTTKLELTGTSKTRQSRVRDPPQAIESITWVLLTGNFQYGAQSRLETLGHRVQGLVSVSSLSDALGQPLHSTGKETSTQHSTYGGLLCSLVDSHHSASLRVTLLGAKFKPSKEVVTPV